MARKSAVITLDSEAEYEKLIQEEIYDSCEDSLYCFTATAWKYMDAVEFIECWHIEAIADHVQACLKGDIRKLIINIPPRCGKSTLVSVAAPAWMWGPNNKPNTKFLTASYSMPLSTRDSLKSRRLIQQPWYQKKWGNNFKLTYDQNVKTRYDNNKYGERISTSVAGLGTGEGYDVLIIDDPLNAKHEASEVKLTDVINWWQGTISTRKNDPKTAREIIIMQRIHEKDLVGHILSEENDFGDWCHLCLPMVWEKKYWISPLGWSDPRTEENELLCPNRYNRQDVDSLKKQLGVYKAAAQLQQKPTPPGGGIIKDTFFRFYANLPGGFEIIILSWDVTFDDTAGSDYTVGQVWGRIGADRYLIDQVRSKMDINAQCKAIVELYKKYPQSRAVLIENKANGMAIAKLLKNPQQINILGCAVPGIILVDPQKYGGDKASRLLNCVAEFSAGNVFFPMKELQPWVEITKKELTMFPKAANDDCVDACSYALGYLAQSAGALTASQQDFLPKSPFQERHHNTQLENKNGFAESASRKTIRSIW